MEVIISIWNNLYPSVVGGVIVWLFHHFKIKIEDRKVEKKYPIAGEYLTIFEDIVENRLVKQYAHATLFQKGIKINGTTQLNNRKWVIEGVVSKKGDLYGAYNAENFLDDGAGNYYLEILSNERFEGNWSGYDSVNKKVVSGRYIFMKELLINDRLLEEKDFCRVVDVIGTELGKDYIEPERLAEYIQNEAFLCQLAEVENKVVGVCISCVLDYNEAMAYLELEKKQVPGYVHIADRIGIIKTIVVLKEYQGRGVGSFWIGYT